MIDLHEIKNTLIKTGKYWVVFTGDSITSCEWVHPNWRDIVIYVLQSEIIELLDGDWKTAEWGIKGFNFAYDGATTADILKKVDNILLVKPQLLIGLMGGNDSAFNVSVGESVENIKKISESAMQAGSKVVWCNSTPSSVDSNKNAKYKPYADAFMAIPDDSNFFKVDMFNIYKKFDSKRFFTFVSEGNPVEGIMLGDIDVSHPNQLGNAYIAKVILKEAFGIDFDPEKYIKETLEGKMFPGY